MRITFFRIISIDLHPLQELTMINNVFLKAIADLIDKIYMHISIVGVNLATTLVNRHEDWFDTAGCLRHERCRARGSNRQAGNIAAPITLHIVIEFRIGLFQT